MNFKLVHNNINVFNLEESLKFYEEALGLKEVKRKAASDGSFIIVFVANESRDQLELPASGQKKNHTIWGTMKSISRSRWTTTTRRTRCMRKWAASVMKTMIWESISSMIPTGTGWRSSLTDKGLR